MNQHHPYHPIIYVRGFAATSDEIEETVADPYMGFNLGSTKTRQWYDGKMRKFFFESPLVRLKDEPIWLGTPAKRSSNRYDDVYLNGEDLTAPHSKDPNKPGRSDITLPYQSIVVFRYYDEASQAFGTGETPPIQHFAKELSALILRLRVLVCAKGLINPFTDKTLDNGVDPDDFRVYLIAHSMGGLVCRAFLQNIDPEFGAPEARSAVDKLFTYATPHNGIDLRIVRNVPGWATFGDVKNFNRIEMSKYFGYPAPAEAKAEDLDVSIVQNFPPERIFNLIGSNPADYVVMRGMSAWAAGEKSDGLVRMENAWTHGLNAAGKDVRSPSAYVFRSHSGHYGIVNSEEGYQNLTRFFFGSLRVDGMLDIDEVILPDEIEQKRAQGKDVKASYQFEIVVAVRGTQWEMHRRTVRENSAIHRTYDELFPKPSRKLDRGRSPNLFSVFLDPSKSMRSDMPLEKRAVAFSFDVAVLVPDYQVDGVLWMKQHFEGGFLYREQIVLEALPDAQGGWTAQFRYQGDENNQTFKPLPLQPVHGGGFDCVIPVVRNTKPGIKANLRIEARPWNS